MNKILLPNNAFGGCIMLIVLILVAILPFAIVYWISSMIAPWWISVPLALLVDILVFFKVVKFK